MTESIYHDNNLTSLIEINHLVKIFPPNVVALNDVSVDFQEGEIHAIVGENGAGKSTLMKILYGMIPADSGEILYRGKPIRFANPGEAIRSKIGMVHQEILLIPQYTVWENVILGMEPLGKLNRIHRDLARKQVQDRIDEFQFNLDPDAKVEDLSVAARQKVEILKLLYRDVTFLILDEPTAVLTPQEIPQLFDELRRLRNNGHTIAFISHHLDEVLELSDRISVLRKGKKVATIPASQTSESLLAEMMVGREVVFESIKETVRPGKLIFSLQNIRLQSPNKKKLLDDVNIEVKAGEIVGIAGVEGNGQLELVEVITGLATPDQGHLLINGVNLTKASILERRKYMAFVPQDRALMGSCLNASIKENLIMTHYKLNPEFTRHGHILNDRKSTEFAYEIQEKFDIQLHSIEDEMKSLSGGNQQKVILGRELLLSAPFILLDQPTRGLDVGSIEYVHQQIIRMSKENRAILLLSSDLEELFRITDRILVLHRGQIVANLITNETNINEVGYLMLEGAAHGA
ncbi:MAG TPA: ABC transporter ATP-binding protein [Flexilinea sp.]|nr:ABC transporter ATP-binding protein [Flexilinea sp.]